LDLRRLALACAVHPAVGERVAGLVAVRDVLRPEAKEAVSRLKKQNIRLVMLTGDNERVAKTIASDAGIDEVHAGLLPEDKLRLVRDWQAHGGTVGKMESGSAGLVFGGGAIP